MASTKRKLSPLGKALHRAGACGVRRKFAYSTTTSAFKRATLDHLRYYVARVLRLPRIEKLAGRINLGRVTDTTVFGREGDAYTNGSIGATRLLADVIRAAHPELRAVRHPGE